MGNKRTGPAKLRAWRRDQGWSQAQLAGRLRVDRQTVYRWEAGERRPNISSLMDLQRMGFKSTLADFYG